MTVKDRIYEFIESKGITVKKFETECGLSNGYVSAMRKGFGRNKLNNVLLKFPELNREWLLYGEGEMLKSASSSSQPSQPESSGHPAEAEGTLEELHRTIASQARAIELLTESVKNLSALLSSIQSNQ